MECSSRSATLYPWLLLAASIAPTVFAIPMKAGRTYVVRMLLHEGMSNTARVVFRAHEQDRAGTVTATLSPVKKLEEIKACMRN